MTLAYFLKAPTSKADNAAMPTGMPSKTGSDYVCQAKSIISYANFSTGMERCKRKISSFSAVQIYIEKSDESVIISWLNNYIRRNREMAKKQFKAESRRLLDLMINSIYTHKEIFLDVLSQFKIGE